MRVRILFVGGLDSGGGAGILRDTATAAGLGAASAAALTAVTAQSDASVRAMRLIPPDLVAAQIAAACEGSDGDGTIGAVKIGMLGNAAIVQAVAAALPDLPLVLDPVLAASSGRRLLDEEGVEAMLSALAPRTALLTPNLPELAALGRHLGLGPAAAEDAIVAALRGRGVGAVLVKGGHADGGAICEDRLHPNAGPPIVLAGPRIDVRLRGTGCRLASAIAVHLAQGAALETAVRAARDLVAQQLRAAARPSPPG